MTLTIKKTIVVEEEVQVELPLYWKLDNWFHKIEQHTYVHDNMDSGRIRVDGFQLTSVTSNSISKTLMTLHQFEAYYSHYKGLYEEITEQEFVAEFDKLNNYLK